LAPLASNPNRGEYLETLKEALGDESVPVDVKAFIGWIIRFSGNLHMPLRRQNIEIAEACLKILDDPKSVFEARMAVETLCSFSDLGAIIHDNFQAQAVKSLGDILNLDKRFTPVEDVEFIKTFPNATYLILIARLEMVVADPELNRNRRNAIFINLNRLSKNRDTEDVSDFEIQCLATCLQDLIRRGSSFTFRAGYADWLINNGFKYQLANSLLDFITDPPEDTEANTIRSYLGIIISKLEFPEINDFRFFQGVIKKWPTAKRMKVSKDPGLFYPNQFFDPRPPDGKSGLFPNLSGPELARALLKNVGEQVEPEPTNADERFVNIEMIRGLLHDAISPESETSTSSAVKFLTVFESFMNSKERAELTKLMEMNLTETYKAPLAQTLPFAEQAPGPGLNF